MEWKEPFGKSSAMGLNTAGNVFWNLLNSLEVSSLQREYADCVLNNVGSAECDCVGYVWREGGGFECGDCGLNDVEEATIRFHRVSVGYLN